MIRAVSIGAVLLLTFALNGWTPGFGGTSTSPRRAVVVAADGTGSDLGNGRPEVTFDGLMVRRRVVIAIRPPSTADLALLHNELDRAAARRHIRLSAISASVLDPALLERLAPALVVALPAGTTRGDAANLLDPSSAEDRRLTDEAQDYDVVPVLVHDLRFTVNAADPAALSRAIAREGILSDALGNYRTTLGKHKLDIAYTGPLLSDHLVEAVRNGIARPAGIGPKAVTVSPRSTTGVGVDLTREPAPAPAAISASPGHRHGTGDDSLAATPVGTTSSGTNLWADLLAAVVVLLMFVTLVRLFSTKPVAPSDENESAGTSPPD